MKKIFFLSALLALLSFNPLSAQNYDSAGDSIFASDQIHDIHLQFNQIGYWDSLINNYTLDKYMVASVIFGGDTLDSIGVKLKGNSSFNNNSIKKSMKIGLDEYINGQDVDGMNKFNLNNGFKDPTFMREKIMLDFLNENGLAAPRCTYARVYLNGAYYGLYMLVEEANKEFMKDRFNDKRGNVFKGDPHGDLRWYGAYDSLYYPHYELKTNETTNNWSDLVHLIDKINNTPAAQFYDSLEQVLNTTTFINQWAITNMFVDLDSYIGSGHNYYIYHDSIQNRFEWISWDVNEAFGNFNMQMSMSQLENLSISYLGMANSRPLCSKMLADPIYFQEYINALCYFINHGFSNADLDPKIDSLANKIRTDVYADPNKFYSNQDFETNQVSAVGNTAGLKTFITNRRTSLVSQMATYGCWLGTQEPVTNDEVRVSPNPFAEYLNIGIPSTFQSSETKLECRDMLGRGILLSTEQNSTEIKVNGSELSSGVYFIRLTGNGHNSGWQKIIRR